MNASAFSTEKNKTVLKATDVSKNRDKQTFCAPCNIYFHTNNLSSHLNGFRHKNNVKSTTENEERSDEGSTKNSDESNELKTYCATCNFHINTKWYEKHINGRIHKSNLFTESDLLQFTFKDEKCRVCNVSVSSNHNNMMHHLHGANHKGIFRGILTKYKIDKINNQIACGVCAQQFEVETFLDHIIETHEAAEETKLTRCRICRIQVADTPKSVEDHENSLKHLKNLKKHDHRHLERLSVSVRCKVCDKTIDILESNSHVVGLSHLQKLDSLLHDNKNILLKRGNLYICCLCSLIIEGEKGFDHIFTTDHKVRLAASDSRILKCIFCNVELPNDTNSIESHEQGDCHKANFIAVVENLSFQNGQARPSGI